MPSGAVQIHLKRNDDGKTMIYHLSPSPLASEQDFGQDCRTTTLAISTTSRNEICTAIVRTNSHIEVLTPTCPSLRLTLYTSWYYKVGAKNHGLFRSHVCPCVTVKGSIIAGHATRPSLSDNNDKNNDTLSDRNTQKLHQDLYGLVLCMAHIGDLTYLFNKTKTN